MRYISLFYPETKPRYQKKRIGSYRKGYMKIQPDFIIMNGHKFYNLLCFELETNYKRSESQLKIKEQYLVNGYEFIISNIYDLISRKLYEYMPRIRIKCRYCTNKFKINESHPTQKSVFINIFICII